LANDITTKPAAKTSAACKTGLYALNKKEAFGLSMIGKI
jgi:hypothetical protein